MARVNVYVPDDLYERALSLPGDVSWSRVLRDGLLARVGEQQGCPHERVQCSRCGTRLATGELVEHAQGLRTDDE